MLHCQVNVGQIAVGVFLADNMCLAQVVAEKIAHPCRNQVSGFFLRHVSINIFQKREKLESKKNKDNASDKTIYIKTKIEYIKLTYSNLINKKVKLPKSTWKELKSESEKLFEKFKKWVEDKVKKQLNLTKNEKEEIVQELENGYWSPESVAQRIIDFAISITKGDKSKIELLKNAVKKAFENVKELFGGKLPKISQRTYNLVMKKFDEWENESNVQFETTKIEYIVVNQEIIEDFENPKLEKVV